MLFDIAVKSYTAAYEYLWEDKGAAYIKKFYSTQLLAAEIDSYFLVYSQRKIAGYFKIKENSFGPYAQKDCLEVEKLYFLPSFTGKGIGKYIIVYIEKLAEAQQKALIWLSVMQSSPANSFYKANGFIQVQESYLAHPYMKDEYRTLVTLTKPVKASLEPQKM